MNFLAQLFGGMTQIWLNVAFVVCIFTVLTFKPERIVNLSVFRLGCVLFALSLIAPSLAMFLLSSGESTGRSLSRDPFDAITWGMKIVNLLPPMLFAGAFLAAVSSIMPKPGTTTTTPQDLR